MTARKRRQKDRRRAQRLARQAWENAEEGNPHRAIRIIQRAIDANPSNPALWTDLGLLIRQLHGDENDAAKAFLAAISLAPDMAEPHAQLAEIRMRQGLLQEAIALQARAAEIDPESAFLRQRLASWQSLLRCESAAEFPSIENIEDDTECPFERALRARFASLADHIQSLDWADVEEKLTNRGAVCIRHFLASDSCDELISLFEQAAPFARTVIMDRQQFGRGAYRYFSAPLPPLVDAIRRLTYPHVAGIANRWQRLLGRDDLFPSAWEGYRKRCEAAGQTTSTPILLRYEAGGFNALHRDLRGTEYFPVQLLIVLSPAVDSDSPDGFTGGEFLFCDSPERKKKDRRQIAAGRGDAVLFCTRDRLVQIGGAWGLKPVKHGMTQIECGTRFALGVPFHEYE